MSRPVPEHLIPPDEEARVQALHDLEILDSERERRFDALVAELAKKLDVPIAYLALIAEDRQWIKSKVGPLPTHAHREDAFCSHTILGDEPVLVSDATQDPRFANGPLVQDDPNLRFYAGIPISDVGGHNVGTVCVAGPTPREITPRDLAILEGFADRLQEELNRRPTVLLAYATEDEELVGRFIASDPRLEDPTVVDLWSSRRGAAADGEWRLKDALWRARSAVLMVSPAFLRCHFVEDEALQMLLKAREAEEFTTTVVLLEPCDRSEVDWLASRAPWPANDQAITIGSEAEIDRLFRDLAIELVGEPPAETDEETEAAARSEDVQLFLSHAGEDAAAVKDLAGRLRRAGVNVWLDVDELQPGDDWMQALEDALDASDAFAVYIGRSGVARWVSREVRVALDRNAKDPRFRFIPILGPGADVESLPRFVAQHHWLDVREGDPQPEEIRKLVASILSRPAESLSLLPPGEPPFRGLLTFGAEHAHLFFGRDQETKELLERLQTSPFLAVIGDSGSGKSSLVRAGLVPALHRGHFRDAAATSPTWRVVVLKPGSDPFRELASGLLDLLPEATPAERMATLKACADQLGEGTQGLCNALSALVEKGEHTLLVIDQFEEVFTQSQDPDERDRFIDTLLAASNCDGERPLYTIVTLRADFYSHCFEHPTLPKVLSTSQYAVRAIAPDKLVEVIEKPATLAGIRLEPGLVEAILFDLGEGPGNLPLLEHTLLELWKLRTGETLTHASYEEIGRVQGALEHHAEEVYATFDDEGKQLTRKLLLSLVVPTENAGPARRRVRVGELLPAGDRRAAAEAVLQRLVDERLLMVRGASDGGAPSDETAGNGQYDNEVEVTHEALLRGWRRLGGWLEEDREFLFWRQRTSAAFSAWQESGRDSGALLRGAPLADAERWLRTRGEDMSPDGRSFIDASIALARRQKRIRGAVMATIAVIGAVALVLAWIATQARREAEDNLLLATTAVDEMLTRVGSEALEDVPQLEEVREELLARARALYEQLSEQRSGASGLRLQTALAPARMAKIQRQMGESAAARQGLESAIAELDALVREEPGRPEYRLELAKIHNDLGWLVFSLGEAAEFPQAADHYDRALEIQEALFEAQPQSQEYAYELARSHLNRSILRARQEEFAGAENDLGAAIGYVEPFASQPGEWRDRIRQQLARSHNESANLFSKQKKNPEAAAQYKLAAGLFESLTDDNPKSREYRKELAQIYNNLALHQRRHGDPREAEDYGRRAIELFGELAKALPEIRSEWANALRTQGLVLIELEQRDEAAASLRRASAIFAELLSDHPERPNDRFSEAVTLLYLGSLRVDAGEINEVRRVRARLGEILPLLPADRRQAIERHRMFRRLQEPA